MTVNRYLPHVLILPEDDANRQVANGFHLQVALPKQRHMQVLAVAGGWSEVIDLFESDHIPQMNTYLNRFMILLIDFDGQGQARLDAAKARIPEDLTDRVFVLGASSEPEDLKLSNLGSYEDIGLAMANDCRHETETIWRHNLLRHNAPELERLRRLVRPILF